MAGPADGLRANEREVILSVFKGFFFANEMQLSALESEDPGAVFGLITAV